MNTGIQDAPNLAWKLALVAATRRRPCSTATTTSATPSAPSVVRMTTTLTNIGTWDRAPRRRSGTWLFFLVGHVPAAAQSQAPSQLAEITINTADSALSVQRRATTTTGRRGRASTPPTRRASHRRSRTCWPSRASCCSHAPQPRRTKLRNVARRPRHRCPGGPGMAHRRGLRGRPRGRDQPGVRAGRRGHRPGSSRWLPRRSWSDTADPEPSAPLPRRRPAHRRAVRAVRRRSAIEIMHISHHRSGDVRGPHTPVLRLRGAEGRRRRRAGPISDMWSTGPGGWTYEWSRRAAAWPRCPSTSTAVSPPTDPC